MFNSKKSSSLGIKQTSSSLKDRRILWLAVFIVAAMISAGFYVILNNVSKQDTYYVLAHSVAARTKITPDDVTAQTLSGTKPQNALTISDLQQGNVYSKYPINGGDVVQASNAGPLDSLNEGIPDNWVITSFTVGSEDMPTSLQRGDYFDLIIPANKDSDGKTAAVDATKYLFRNVMILQTSSAVAGTTDDAKGGQAGSTTDSQDSNITLVVGMSPKNAALLQTVVNENYHLKLVISPKQTLYQSPKDLDKLYNLDYYTIVRDATDPTKPGSIIASGCVDNNNPESELNQNCTDPTFAPQKRDAFGVPYNAKKGDLDADGNVKKLTAFEKQWCEQLYTNSYYSTAKWDGAKTYCSKNGVKKPANAAPSADESTTTQGNSSGSSSDDSGQSSSPDDGGDSNAQ